MLRHLLPPALTVVVDVLAWGLLHAATGYAAHRLPDARLRRDGWLLRPRPFEVTGRFYRQRLHIHAWKDLLPEAGDLFPGGISKSRLPGRDDAGLELFVRETRRAELGHWWAACCGPLFLVFNPPLPAALLVGYGVVVNLPFVAIQRYNRVRAQAVLRRRAHRVAGPGGRA